METKICTDCKKDKPLSDYYKQKDRKNGHSQCKECFNDYCIRRWIQRKIDAIIYKGSKCEDCTTSYPETPYVVFDFHHLDPSEKDIDWNKMRLRSIETLYKELNKCVLLCSNCHRIRHHNEN